uniref:Fibroblast activation protein, alpha n=1 Tax=Cyprinus carpio TaxID=7962 RepID=A0A8C1ZJ91_CYPCA
MCILILVSFAVFSGDESAFKRTYSFNDFYNDTIRYKTYSLHWISDNEYLHKTSEGHIYLHNVETKESSMYLSNSTFAQVDATDYILSGDKRFVVFESNYSKVWRHSFTASYHMYNMESREFLSKVQIPPVTQLLVWAPVENKLAYVWNYNIYLKKNATAEAVQVTHNGKVNKILNGVPDWVYEEEVFASNEAIWWSPQGKYLAYLQINDTGVHNIEYSLYGNDQYPTTVFIPYPKVSKYPTLEFRVMLFYCSFPSDHYLRTVTWVTDERLAVQWLPRRQDSVLLQIYDYDGTNWKETSVRINNYMVLTNSLVFFLCAFIVKLSRSKIYSFHRYYVSNEHMGRPGQRNLYKISISKSGHSAPECLTCSLYQDRCQYNSAYFSLNASFFRMDCYGPGLPLFTLMDNRGPAKEIQVLEDNKKLEKILTTELLMPTIKRATMKIAGFNLWYQMMFPPNFDSSKKYPLLIQVYGGPASQNTDYVFRLEWATYLCSTEKVIIASFDGRGSGFQGDELMHAIYGRLGTYEVEDQISAVRKFIEMGFIDKDRIGMWGWSYGGYVTSMVLGSGSGLFKCGIAVAPVAKWDYYEIHASKKTLFTIYPNYEELSIQCFIYLVDLQNSTVTDRAKNFKSVQYMLVHGTADDNVHFQQAAQISKALVENQVDFEAMWYTDKDHGLSGKARYHLYAHLNHFLQNCFAEKK